MKERGVFKKTVATVNVVMKRSLTKERKKNKDGCGANVIVDDQHLTNQFTTNFFESEGKEITKFIII